MRAAPRYPWFFLALLCLVCAYAGFEGATIVFADPELVPHPARGALGAAVLPCLAVWRFVEAQREWRAAITAHAAREAKLLDDDAGRVSSRGAV